ncbi:MAG: DNA-3-methyladenine glycosylase 2 family protein, partial [Pseudomonadota bacterium]
SQVISRRAADVLWGRLTATLDPDDAIAVAEAPDSAFLDAGLTRSKMTAMRHAAMAIQNGSLVLDNPTDGSRQGLGGRTALDALKHLTAIKGIGPWTAEVYLLFAVGHLDVFPAGDVALQSMVQSHFERPERPKAVEVRRLVEPFQPLRGVLARVFYAAYGARQTATPTWRGAPV